MDCLVDYETNQHLKKLDANRAVELEKAIEDIRDKMEDFENSSIEEVLEIIEGVL